MERKKKALIISLTPHFYIGGVETYNNHLINFLASLNYSIDEYCVNELPFPKKSVRTKNNHAKVINNSREYKTKNNQIKVGEIIRQTRQSLKDIAKLVKENNYDLIIDSRQGPFKWNKKLGVDFSKNKNCIWVQHLFPDFYNGKYLTWFNGKFFLAFLKMWITIWKQHRPYNYKNLVLYDEFNKQEFKQAKLIDKNVYCIPLSVKPAEYLQTKKEIDFVYLGRIKDEQKNLGFLVRVSKFLKKKISLYGDGDYVNSIKNIKNLDYRGVISQKDIKKILDKTKYIILVSKFEGFGFVLVEALSHGVIPIVLNTYPSARFLTKYGYLLDANISPENYAEFLNNLDYTNDIEKAKKCAEFARKNLNFDNFKKSWIEIIKKHSL